MKRTLAIILALMLMLALCACGGNSEPAEPSSSEETTTAPADTTGEETKPSYTVKVVDEDGNPISGAMVQLCKDVCIPAVTDESGVAAFFLAEDEYKVSFPALPAGYTYSGEEDTFYFAPGANELTITLKAAA